MFCYIGMRLITIVLLYIKRKTNILCRDLREEIIFLYLCKEFSLLKCEYSTFK